MERISRAFRKRFMSFFVFGILGVTALILICLSAAFNTSSFGAKRAYSDFSSGWKYGGVSEMSLNEMSTLLNFNPGDVISFTNTIPDDLPIGSTLAFRSSNVGITVYIDGKQVYEFGNDFEPIYGKSPGNNWNLITLPDNMYGKTITLDVTMCYKDSSGDIDNIYIGLGEDIIADQVRGNALTIFIGIIILTLGVTFILIDFSLSSILGKKHAMLYFGLFAIISGVWILLETRLFSLIESNTGLLHIMAGIAMIFCSVPVLLYSHDTLQFRHKWMINTMTVLSLFDISASMILHFTGIADFHETAIFTHIILILTSVVLISLSIENIAVSGKNKKFNIMFLTGGGILGLTVVLDVSLYYFTSSTSVLRFTSVGLLAFIVTSAFLSFNEVTDLLKLGLKANLIGKLAYTDGLTNIGNTTAFKTELDRLEREKEKYSTIGIVQFDVNDLKKLNDTHGHEAGDLLITQAADIIHSSFSPIGSCFRIGGDEFVAVITADHAPQCFDEAIKHFDALINAHNRAPDKQFDISIAYGVAFYESGTGGILREILKQADARMYKKKRQMKDDF